MNLDMLVCPACQGPVELNGQAYACLACARAYPIRDGIPDFFYPPVEGTEAEADPVWRENLVWLDPRMAGARETIYRLSARRLKGMTYAMQRLAELSFPGCRILEVGTGTGHFTAWMAQVCAPGSEIYAIDFSDPMFAFARANTAGLPGIYLMKANSIGVLPFRMERFDFIFLRLAPLIVEGQDSLHSALRLLKPGGWLFKAGWKPRHPEEIWTEGALQAGFDQAESHDWQYHYVKTREEYDASLVESEVVIAHGGPRDHLTPPPWQGEPHITTVWEHLRIGRKASS